MKISDAGLALIRSFEGLRLNAYDDVAGKQTIGYGHLIKSGETFDGGITQEDAESLLESDVSTTEKCVTSLVRAAIAQNEFDALVCFAYNLGCRALQNSTLLRRVNVDDMEGAAEQFLRWDMAGGKVVQGLTNRRIAERALFLGIA